MNKKKLLAFAMVLSMVAIVAIGGTLAYFVSTDFVPNTFVVGNVYIDLDEAPVYYNDETNTWESENWIDDPDPEDRTDNNQYINFYPGAVLPKDPVIHNNGANDAYVRATITVNPYAMGYLMNDDATTNLANLESLVNIDKENWTIEADSEKLENFNPFEPDNQFNATYSVTYRYNEILKPTKSTTPLFTEVTIPTTLKTMYEIGDFNIDVFAEAIQSDSFANADEAWDAFEAQENPQE